MAKKPHNDESVLLAEAFSDILEKDKPSPKKTYKLKTSVKVTLVIIVVLILLIPAVFIVLAQNKPSATETQLRKYQPGFSFQLYAPKNLPGGYKLAEDKTANVGGALFVTFVSSDSSKPQIV